MDAPTIALGLLAAAAIPASWGWALRMAYEADEWAARAAQLEDALARADVGGRRLREQRDRLARLVDSGDLDGARAMALGILEGEGDS